MQISSPYELTQDARWYLVHTRPNCERKAEINLKAQGLKTFLPHIEKTIRHARRLTTVRRPLFARYLFVSLDIGRDRWSPINSTIGVSRLVAQEGRPIPLPFGIVETLLALPVTSRTVSTIIITAKAALLPRGADLLALIEGKCRFHPHMS